jgi:type II secretory pathway component PulK
MTYDLQNAQNQNQNNQMQVRYGLVDENSKFNLNTLDTDNPEQARKQLLALFEGMQIEDVDPRMLADSLIDWLDKDDKPVSDMGAESDYYMTLEPPYRAKNRKLDTVEELLMIKGFTGRVLYGEDYNRNGFLDPNENDGEEEGSLFPPDNGDGKLNRGLLPYVTVYTRDWNILYDNKININMIGTGQLPDAVSENLGGELVEFIKNVRSAGYTFETVGELYRLEVWQNGWSNYHEYKKEYEEKQKEREGAEESEGEGWEDGPEDELPGQGPEDEGMGDQQPDGQGPPYEEGDGDDLSGPGDGEEDISEEDLQELKDNIENERRSKDQRRYQAVNGGDRPGPSDGSAGLGVGDGRDRDGRRAGRDGRGRDGRDGRGGQDGREEQDGDGSGRDGKDKELERPDGPPDFRSPVRDEQSLALALQYLTAASGIREGLINVNTAPARVLKTLPALTDQEVESIISTRKNLSSAQKASFAWLATGGALDDFRKFGLICNKITAKPCQFSINVIGFADHVGTTKRIQAVVDFAPNMSMDVFQAMSNMGSQLQPKVLTKYYRDITPLRIGYPLTEDAERRLGIATGTE